jgi:hypothetical protein
MGKAGWFCLARQAYPRSAGKYCCNAMSLGMGLARWVRWSFLTAGLALACCQAGAADNAAALNDADYGERIYTTGILANGQPLRGTRTDGVKVAGAAAACIQCHRASGMGGAEGSQRIPPVIGALLRAPGQRASARTGRASPSIERSEHVSATRAAYTAASFAQALVAGVGPGGHTMGYLMPRFELDDASLKQLLAYLDTLPLGQVPGVDDKALHLATIVTADTPVAQRQATLDIISRCLAERSPRPSGRPDALRPWQHHVWQLGSDPALWPQELAQYQRQQSVFAVLSGTSGGAWTPIHQFCEQQKLPCVLPNTAAVDDTQASHWSFYFSRGVSLEAAALAQRLMEQAPAGGWRRIVQRTDDSESARLAAAALQRHLRAQGSSAELEQRQHDPLADKQLAITLTERDALVLWLNPAALHTFTHATAAPQLGQVIISGELGGLDDAPVATAWRERAWILYAYEPAERRNGRILLNSGHWMARQSLALQPALSRLQGNTYSACEVTVRALHTMRERYSQEYFLELIEAADEAAVATAYPRFTLGPGQRYGSKSAYVMHYPAPTTKRLAPAGEAVVPH